MPHIMVKMVAGRSEEQKQKLAKALTKAVTETIGAGEEWISIGIEDYSWDDWCKTVYPDEIKPILGKLYKKPDYNV